MQKAYVGLSGGVDSATSAALLKEQGHDVTGVFIKIWSPEFIECTWREDRLDAMRVAAHLQIPFLEIDLSKEYKERVIESMLSEYRSGATPNPDVSCNEYVKFGTFFDWATEQGADFLATGHYARIKEIDGKRALLRAADESKDQSYFLHRIPKEKLARTLFPIGHLRKAEVREKARKLGLPIANKPDSQGLCFVGDITLSEFLGNYVTFRKGAVLSESGQKIGEHRGAALYTIGERHGFSASSKQYVVATDVGNNTITVADSIAPAQKVRINVSDLNWLHEPRMPAKLQTQARYRQVPAQASADMRGDTAIVTFESPQIAAPGQSLVFYEGQRCLGGGIIDA